MKRFRIIAIALSCVFQAGLAQTIDQVTKVVAFLNADIQIDSIRGVFTGTAFFVLDKEKGYLVTAEHVARVMKLESRVIVELEGNKSQIFRFRDFCVGCSNLIWSYHDSADVAVLKIIPTEVAFKVIDGRFLSLEWLDNNEQAPQRERPIVMLGFPLPLASFKKFSPISQECKPASGLVRMFRADNGKEATFFLLDKPSAQGFSGGPAFRFPSPYYEGSTLIIPSDTLKCFGLVHGTMSDETGGKFAAVVPSRYIIETIRKVP